MHILERDLKQLIGISAKIQVSKSISQEMLHLPGGCAFQQKCHRDQRASQHHLRDIMVMNFTSSATWRSMAKSCEVWRLNHEVKGQLGAEKTYTAYQQICQTYAKL